LVSLPGAGTHHNEVYLLQQMKDIMHLVNDEEMAAIA